MQIKKGDILVKNISKIKVLEILGDIFFLSQDDDFEVVGDMYTKQEILEDGWKVESPKWEPKMREIYWYISYIPAGIDFALWWGDSFDLAKQDGLGVYPTKEAAQAMYDKLVAFVKENQ